MFQAVRKGETEVGVSVHTMEAKIDKGILLAQSVVPVTEDETVDTLYQKCFDLGAITVHNALERIAKEDIVNMPNEYEESYYSFPEKEHWKDFRTRGIKFI